MKNICLQMNRKAWLAIAMVMFMALPALAQKVTVTGTVYDPDGDPAIGASVTVQGVPGVGAATDLDGNFAISADPSKDVLVISYVGAETQNIALDGRTHIDVYLKGNSQVLNELVVVGYGTVKKKDATGSVAVVKPDDIQAGLATSANDLLVGATPGVVVTTDGGNPGGGATIRIRGGASLNATNDPLIVIDGVPMSGGYGSSNAMTMLSPDNIESMTVLKSASATAIYGSRASNGVIIITTKKGASGRPQVNFSANFHVNNARKTWDVMDAATFRQYIQKYSPSSERLLGNADTNWQDEVLRTSFSQDYNLSVGGTVGFLPYRVSVSYTDNNGIIRTNGMSRTNVGFNLTPKFFDGLLQIQANVKGSYIVDRNAGLEGAVAGAVGFNPTVPVYTNYTTSGVPGMTYLGGYTSYINNDGNLETNGALNPVSLIEGVHKRNKAWTSTGNLMVDYALHFLPELHLNLNLGYDVTKGETTDYSYANTPNTWKNGYMDGAGSVHRNHSLYRNTLLEFYANYKKEFEAIRSNLDVMAGYSWQRIDEHGRSWDRYTTNGWNKTYDAATNAWDITEKPWWESHVGQGYGSSMEQMRYISYSAGQLNLISFYGRINYSFDDTYLFTFTIRDDGTSRFSKDNRWGVFPSAALAWKINNMDFFEGVDKMNEFKLRMEWGETGQQAVGGYNMYSPTYSISVPSASYPSITGQWISPYYPNSFNGALKWETTTTWNVGVDMAFLNNRITASVDWYLRNTRDLLAYVPVPAGVSTTNAMDRNIGKLRNIGVEFNIGAKPIVSRDFNWSTALNVAWNSNKITELTGSADEDKTFSLDAYGNPASENAGAIEIHRVGYPAFSFRVLEQVYDKDGNPIPNVYVDQNGDGEIDANDLVVKHSRDPKVTINWNNTFNYKNWDLGFVLRASIGNYVYNAVRPGGINLSTIQGQGNIVSNKLVSDFYFNDSTAITNLVRSSYFLENAGFVRCDNITLGYTFNNLLQDKLKLRLFGAVQNPFVITKYSGLDPEVFSGVDNNVYPRPTTYSLGLVATF